MKSVEKGPATESICDSIANPKKEKRKRRGELLIPGFIFRLWNHAQDGYLYALWFAKD